MDETSTMVLPKRVSMNIRNKKLIERLVKVKQELGFRRWVDVVEFLLNQYEQGPSFKEIFIVGPKTKEIIEKRMKEDGFDNIASYITYLYYIKEEVRNFVESISKSLNLKDGEK